MRVEDENRVTGSHKGEETGEDMDAGGGWVGVAKGVVGRARFSVFGTYLE